METVALQSVTLPAEIQSLVDRMTTTEGRLGITGGIVLVTTILAAIVAPLVVRWTARTLYRRTPKGRVRTAVDRASEYGPLTISGFVLRTIQLGLLALAAVTLLAVWGLVGVALDALAFLGLSIPLFANIATTLGIALAAYVAADILHDSVHRFADNSDRVTDHQSEIILRVGNLSIIALALASGLTVWGIDLSGLLVGAGFLGIVVGLAARQTLGSLIAGFVLMFSRPFTIGDWVQIGEHEGIVTDITIVNTRLQNFDGETIVIPNDQVGNAAIINRSERGHLRIRLDVGVDYDTDPEFAADIARESMHDLKPVADSPPPRVIPKSFGDSAVVLELRFWIDRPMPPRKWRAIETVVQAVKEQFEAEGIKIPFPQQELSGRAETGGFQIREHEPTTESVDPSTDGMESEPSE